MQYSITLLQALIGFKKTFNHLDGHQVDVERTEVTPPGYILKLDGQGMPLHGSPDIAGNLYITFTILFPDKVNQEQIEGFKKLLSDI